MLDAAQATSQFIKESKRQDLEKNLLLSSALIRQLEILGEAASGVTPEFRQRFSHIPWHKIIGMRNRLIHAYFDVDLDVVWQAVTVEIPIIIPELENIIKEMGYTHNE
ncbi:MAG: DUF86 domain-containing protein [Parachlamydia sp.]|nr:DUF86 domain-containing protein [Parachlamydia sp.]